EKEGAVFYRGGALEDFDRADTAAEIGFVLQQPESQIVTDRVWHELAFGLENLGLPTEVIRRRVGEMAGFFGIEEWFNKDVEELSGGQKQLLNLASVMVMQPKVLILDEPTSQLDPIAAADFIYTLQRLNRELGLTVILSEHRLEDVFPVADRVMVMDEGKIAAFDNPRKIASALKKADTDHPMLKALPCAVRIFDSLKSKGDSPLTVKEGRLFLEENYKSDTKELPAEKPEGSDEYAAKLKDVWFRYEKNTPDVLRGLNLSVKVGEHYCILGGNGTGKTTSLNVLSGLNKAYAGKIYVLGKRMKDYKGNELYRGALAMLPQNSQSVFFKNTVREDLEEICQALGYDAETTKAEISAVSQKLSVDHLMQSHPFDLSGGEQQKCALAKMLLLKPRLLLLDEPTKGIDAFAKLNLMDLLKELKGDGITILTVTHDVEFAALSADRCALFFDGEIISQDLPREFFSQNSFYTTAANRIARSLYPKAITCEDVTELCKINGEKNA
ncbi:MAG TPA: ABC transporter ATP-binding protein, partial [Oscillospiraceae bacterium]|nr:ABC transporter ATP-binding protein [Oscillospiraceae bacterium]